MATISTQEGELTGELSWAHQEVGAQAVRPDTVPTKSLNSNGDGGSSSRDMLPPASDNGASRLTGNGTSTSLQIPKRTWADRREIANMFRVTGVPAAGSSRRCLSSVRV